MDSKLLVPPEVMLERYRYGLCPVCSHEMERRPRRGDFYCHRRKCKRAWNIDSLFAEVDRMRELFRADLSPAQPIQIGLFQGLLQLLGKKL